MASKDYRKLKLELNKYHKFSFNMPRKGKDFTPQQKTAITRQANKLKTIQRSLKNNTAGFIKLSNKELNNLPENFDYLAKTNTGVFTKFSNPTKVRTKDKKKLILKTKFGRREEIFYPFPTDLNTMDKIKDFVNALMKKKKPDYVRWSVKGYRGSELFSPDTFNNYASDFGMALKNAGAEKRFKDETFFNGVFLGWLDVSDK